MIKFSLVDVDASNLGIWQNYHFPAINYGDQFITYLSQNHRNEKTLD